MNAGGFSGVQIERTAPLETVRASGSGVGSARLTGGQQGFALVGKLLGDDLVQQRFQRAADVGTG